MYPFLSSNAKLRAGIFITLFLIASLLSLPARADCINPAGEIAVMVYNPDFNVMQFCDGTDWIYMGSINPSAGPGDCINPDGTEAEMVYNVNYKTMQFCNGQDWVSMSCNTPSSYGCTPPTGCENIGDLCADGSLFAGFILNGTSCRAVFVTDDNQAIGGRQWKTAGGTNDIATDSYEDGSVNQSQVSPITSFEAFNDCDILNRHSQTDWYLPAQEELRLLWKNKAAIDANATGNFMTSGPNEISRFEIDRESFPCPQPETRLPSPRETTPSPTEEEDNISRNLLALSVGSLAVIMLILLVRK